MSANAEPPVVFDVKDLSLADAGRHRIEWAFQSMPVLQAVRKQFIKAQPLAGVRIAACLHATSETANLMITLRDGGASVALCGSNPMSTQDDVAACLARDYGIAVYAVHDADPQTQAGHLGAVVETKPHVAIDDGCTLATALHARGSEASGELFGGTEEAATGVLRARAMAAEGALPYPLVAINTALTKHLFDNRYGTGQSTIDGILRTTNLLMAGLNVVVAGYGWCGKGVAQRAKGFGANMIVTEVNPIRALEALMDGCRVMSMGEAAPIGDLFITVTGNRSVIGREHLERLKDGAILCNAGHSDVEIEIETLEKLASSRRKARELVEEFVMRDGRRIFLLAGGRLVNLAAAEGHPAAVMDLSFANQALSVEYIVRNHRTLEKRIYMVPEEVDKQVARMKLDSMGVKVDRLSIEQERYLSSWPEGKF